MSVLEAADGESERAAAAAHEGTAAIEGQAPRERTICGTRPIVADGANIEERTTAAVAGARHSQSQRGKRTGCISVITPAYDFGHPLSLGSQPEVTRTSVYGVIKPEIITVVLGVRTGLSFLGSTRIAVEPAVFIGARHRAIGYFTTVIHKCDRATTCHTFTKQRVVNFEIYRGGDPVTFRLKAHVSPASQSSPSSNVNSCQVSAATVPSKSLMNSSSISTSAIISVLFTLSTNLVSVL